jgi:YegS/Rv2252/BmrU family lipid kinase
MSAAKKHLVFIVNPKSGRDRVKAIKAAVQAGIDGARYSYDIQMTQYAKHGTELAAAAAKAGAYAVVAVGGDGSINDIVAGLLGTPTALAVIPKGSGNGMARSMEIPLTVHKAIAVINRGKTSRMDIAFADERPFVSNAGVAFDALISQKFASSQRRGFGAYSWLVTRHLWTYRSLEWDIQIDGQKLKENAFMVNVANGRQFGYDFKIAPDADWSDGLLDVVVVRRFPKLLGGGLVLRALKGSILKSPYVKRYRASEVTISNPALRLMQTDGDAHPCGPRVKFRIERQALEVVVP